MGLSDHNIVFGKLVRELRLSKKWPQEELAWRAELSRQHLSRLELGENSGTIDSARAISHALGLPFSEFLILFARRLQTTEVGDDERVQGDNASGGL